MKIIYFLLIFSTFVFANSKVEIEAQNFHGDSQAGYSVFTGNVIVTRAKDTIKADKMRVYFTEDREITRFEAEGNTFFDVTTEEGSHFVGSADELVYLPIDQIYTLKGNAVVDDLTEKRKIAGDHIVLNELAGAATVTGKENEPVKMIFTIKDKNESK